MQSAIWAVRFLGLAEPWGLRRAQELVLHALELMVEHPAGMATVPDKGRESLPESWSCLREACMTYLAAPIIPRFEGRLKKSVSGLIDLGLRSVPPGGGADGATPLSGDQCQVALEKTLSLLLGPEGGEDNSGGARPRREFDGSGKGLGGLRAGDGVHGALRRVLAEAALGHLEVGCRLPARRAVLAGAQAIAEHGSGGAWPEEQRRHLLEVLSSVPEVPSPCDGLVEGRYAVASSQALSLSLLGGILLDDVRLGISREESPEGEKHVVTRAAQDPWRFCCSGGPHLA